jgi:hypothetical protein
MSVIRPGLILDLAEQDYAYGVGRLTLRIETLGADPASFPKLEWVRVVGDEIWWDGSTRPRDVMVRVAAIAGSLREADGLPPRHDRP